MISDVAYKKGNPLRYTLWAILALLLVAIGTMFAKTLENNYEGEPDDSTQMIEDEQ